VFICWFIPFAMRFCGKNRHHAHPKNTDSVAQPGELIFLNGCQRHSADGKQRNGAVEANTALQRFIPIQKSKLTRRANTVIVECTKK
jgi:hypothetical protein